SSSGGSSTTRGTFNVTISEVDGERWIPGNTRRINETQCRDGSKMIVGLNSLGFSVGTYPFLEVWLRTGNVDCNTSDRITAIVPENRCTQITISQQDSQLISSTFFDVEIPLSEICATGDGLKSIFFLALSGQGSREAAQQYGVLEFNIDRVPPPSPTNLTALPGETQIKLTWSQQGVADIAATWVLVDTLEVGAPDVDGGTTMLDGGAPAECSSSLLRAGVPFNPKDSRPEGLFAERVQNTSSERILNGENWGREFVAAVAMSEDRNGNISRMSEVVCLQYVQTDGFWDRYRQNGGTAEPGCACSTPGARSSGLSASTALPVFLLLSWFAARWRIRRRAR
ncbi:MAG: hypothetical protein ABW321_06900, partial [Polyangiales bacterium]